MEASKQGAHFGSESKVVRCVQMGGELDFLCFRHKLDSNRALKSRVTTYDLQNARPEVKRVIWTSQTWPAKSGISAFLTGSVLLWRIGTRLETKILRELLESFSTTLLKLTWQEFLCKRKDTTDETGEYSRLSNKWEFEQMGNSCSPSRFLSFFQLF